MRSRHKRLASIRAQVHGALDDDFATGGTPVLVRSLLILLIVCNLAGSVLESDPSLHEPYKSLFDAFEAFSFVVFGLEYAARVWAAPERRSSDGRSGGRAG